jgi:segregation and condensation protein B
VSRKKSKQAVPDEVLAEGSGPVEVVAEPAEPVKKPSKKKFSKKKAPKGKKAPAEVRVDGEVVTAGDESVGDEAELRADDDSEIEADHSDGDERGLRADDGSEIEADELRADGDEPELRADDDSELDADELRVDGASPDADVLRGDGEDSETDGLRADDASRDADELRADDASGLRAGDLSEPDADELGLPSDDADQLGADGEGAGDDAPVIEGDDVVGAPITDEAGVEAALLPGALSAVQLRHLIEALIFATDKPVTLQRLRQLTRVSDVARIESALAELQEDYKDRGIALQQVSGGYQFRTNTAFSSWVQQLIAGRPVRLSRAQLETLAIVAYRQPITRPEIDEIRGVDSSNTLRLLLERSLIRVLGKREEVGRPTLYGTTKEFLDFFSLGDLRELPTLREYSELTAESRQVMSDRLGVPLDANGELEPEVSDDIDPDQLETDSGSIVDSILAEHAAAEAEAEARFDARDASAIAEAAMSGGSSFGNVTDDDDAMALSGGEMSTVGSRAPASEARSYVDAIRASVVESEETDEVELAAFSVTDELSSDSHEPHMTDVGAEPESMSVADELMVESREPHFADASGEGPIEHDAHLGHDDSASGSIDPHVETDESMSASGSDGETTSAKLSLESHAHVGHEIDARHDDSESMPAASGSIDPHVETDESMSASNSDGETTSTKSNLEVESHDGHVDHYDSESMSAASVSMNPHVETDESMAASDSDDETTSAKSNIDVESHDAHLGHSDSESTINPHVEIDARHDDSESMRTASGSIDPHVETDESTSAPDSEVRRRDSESMSAAEELMLQSREPHLADASDEGSMADGETTAAKSDLDVESHDAHLGHDDSAAHGQDASGSVAVTEPDESHDSPSTGDSMVAAASDEPHTGHDASQLGHETNSADSDLDAEPHVGHNAAVNGKPDNDPESSGN